MNEIDYNEATKLNFEHIPIYASSNSVIGTKYITKVYLISNGNNYEMGEYDGKLSEEEVKENFAAMMVVGQERQYGQQRPKLRKELIPTRDRGRSFARAPVSQRRF